MTVTIDGSRDDVGTVMRTFEDFSEASELQPALLQRMGVVLDDLLANIVDYSGSTTVDLEIGHDRWHAWLRFTDTGIAFNPLEARPPDTSLGLDERKQGGLGIHLARTMTDEIRYLRDDDKNILVAIWNLEDRDETE